VFFSSKGSGCIVISSTYCPNCLTLHPAEAGDIDQGDITDEQWEILKLAFVSTGRIAILSDQPEKDWMYDYWFLEAVRW
jgi:hypothetical protein